MKTGFAAAGLALALAGCALLEPFEPDEPSSTVQAGPPRASGTEKLLEYFQQVRRLPAAELAREHDLVRGAYAQRRTDFNRVRLAMVLSIPGSPANDEARALELLEPLMRNPQSSLNGLAVLMGTYLQESRRLGASVQGLQQKLEDLKSLERSLIERERGGAVKR